MDASISIYSLKHFWKKTIFIDFILLTLFVVSIFLNIKWSDPTKGFDYGSFFLNLSASFLSIWITVRLIDNLRNKREKLSQARQTLINNLKHPFEYTNRILPYINERDLDYLKREIKWFDKKWGNSFYMTILKDNEEPIARKLVGLNMQILTDVHNVVVGNKINFNGDDEAKNKELNWRLKSLDDKLREIEMTIEELVFEIWKSDKPISL